MRHFIILNDRSFPVEIRNSEIMGCKIYFHFFGGIAGRLAAGKTPQLSGAATGNALSPRLFEPQCCFKRFGVFHSSIFQNLHLFPEDPKKARQPARNQKTAGGARSSAAEAKHQFLDLELDRGGNTGRTL